MEKSELPLEDLHLEYKKASGNRIPKSIWETVSAFANTDGGTIVLGADEDTSTRELDITGIDDPSELITNLLNTQKSNNQITPQAIFEKNISIKKIGQKNLIYIYVPKNISNRPVYLLDDMFNKTHIREKDSDRYANKDEIMLMLIDFTNPGEMRVSTSDFIRGGTSIARNPKLFNTFLKAKLGEHTGSGGKRIFSITRNLELKHPDISTNVEKTNIKIWSIPDMESFINTLKPEWRPAYSLFKKQLIISFGDVKDLYSTEYQARKALTEMVDAGFISKEGSGKGTKYLVSTNSPIARKMTNKMLSDINDVLVHTQID